MEYLLYSGCVLTAETTDNKLKTKKIYLSKILSFFRFVTFCGLLWGFFLAKLISLNIAF